MELNYCLVADILGFRSLVLSTDDNYQTSLVDSWISLVTIEADKLSLDRVQLISDSVFIAAPPNHDGLSALLHISKVLLEAGLALGLPLRGGIALEQLRWSSQVAHGPAIVRAYEFGNSLEWIGIACDYAFPDLSELWGWSRVVSYEVQTRGGGSVRRPCVSWNVPVDSILLPVSPSRREAVSTPSEEVLTKIRHTAEFRSYLERWRGLRDDPEASRFHG